MKVNYYESNPWKDIVITMITETHPNIKVSTKNALANAIDIKLILLIRKEGT